jgi:hypothetical protein
MDLKEKSISQLNLSMGGSIAGLATAALCARCSATLVGGEGFVKPLVARRIAGARLVKIC